MIFFAKALLNHLVERETYHVMIGRYRNPDMPTVRRFVRSDIKPI